MADRKVTVRLEVVATVGQGTCGNLCRYLRHNAGPDTAYRGPECGIFGPLHWHEKSDAIGRHVACLSAEEGAKRDE